jgi:type I restriction enzyme, S subunit
MSERVPKGWKNLLVNEVFEVGRGRVISKDEIRDNFGPYPVFSSQSTNNGKMGSIRTFDFEGEYITWTTDGAYAGTVFYRTGKFNCTNVCGTLRNTGVFKLDMRFVAEYLSTVAKKHVSYVGNPKLMNGVFGEIEFLLPPFSEQKKIASILTSVDEVIENTKKQIDKLQDLKKATMNELLTKGIGHTEFKDSELGRIPKSWEVLFLHKTKNENDRYSFTGGPFGSNLKNCDFTKSGVRIIQLQNIGDGSFLNKYKIYTSSQKADELISCNIYPDDIILSKMGDPVARATIIPDIETRYIMSSDGIRLSINKKKYDLKFILESINHHSTRNQAKVLSIGSTRQRIGLTDIRKLLIRVPQLDEQKKISSVINSIDLRIKKINQKLVKTKLLKKSLMQELLTGRVRVSVN